MVAKMNIFLLSIFPFLFFIRSTTACAALGGLPSMPGGGNGGGGAGITSRRCLHKDTKVLMADARSVKKAGDLVIGDRVWSNNGKSTPVILTPDSAIGEVQPFITFKTKSGFGTTLTPDHAVFARECGLKSNESWPIKRSGDLKIGDCVPTVDGKEDRVVRITLSEIAGRVQPITENGKLVVNGVVVSCYDYADVNSTQATRHAPLEPARLLYSLGEKIYNSLSNEQYALGLLDSLIKGLGLEKLYFQ